MPSTFAYRVRDRQGALVMGEMVGDSRDLVARKLMQTGLIPLEVTQKGTGFKREIRLFPGWVGLKHLTIFSRQFATMVNSGLPLLRALTVLEQQTDSTELQRVIGQVRVDIEQGASLSGALEKHPKTFSRLYVALVRAGETGGVLDAVLLRLANTLERELQLRRKVRAAMTYPVVVLFFVLSILSAMLIWIVPTFRDLYASLGGTLPLMTRMLLGLSDAFRQFFPFFLGGFALLGFALYRWGKTEKGRFVIDRFKLKVWVFGPLFHKAAMSRFSRTLGALSRSGVPILQALDITAETVNNAVVAKAIADVRASVKEGESLAGPLSRHKVFPPMVVQMMTVGEETGALDEMLEKIADFYDNEVETAVEQLASIIEPVLIVIVGGIVGLMVVSLYLPMFKIFELIR
ncbi:MAG: type II secretion system F family protein [Actinomycetota bacterium]